MNLILAEHGIRKPGGIPLVGNLVAQMNTLIGATVQVAFLDVFDLILSKTHSAFSLPNKRMPTDRRSIVTSALLSQRMPRTHQSAIPCRCQWKPERRGHPSFGSEKRDIHRS